MAPTRKFWFISKIMSTMACTSLKSNAGVMKHFIELTITFFFVSYQFIAHNITYQLTWHSRDLVPILDDHTIDCHRHFRQAENDIHYSKYQISCAFASNGHFLQRIFSHWKFHEWYGRIENVELLFYAHSMPMTHDRVFVYPVQRNAQISSSFLVRRSILYSVAIEKHKYFWKMN